MYALNCTWDISNLDHDHDHDQYHDHDHDYIPGGSIDWEFARGLRTLHFLGNDVAGLSSCSQVFHSKAEKTELILFKAWRKRVRGNPRNCTNWPWRLTDTNFDVENQTSSFEIYKERNDLKIREQRNRKTFRWRRKRWLSEWVIEWPREWRINNLTSEYV